MNTVEQGFLYKKGRKIKVNHKKTNSVLLNNLQIDFILRNKQYIKGYLLDAGCGEKPYSLIYKDITKKSVGCDVEYCIHDQKKVDVFASLDNLPFQNNTFDTVLCTNVLEHVAENEKSFFELSRVLKNKGYIILSVPFLYPRGARILYLGILDTARLSGESSVSGRAPYCISEGAAKHIWLGSSKGPFEKTIAERRHTGTAGLL